jgi:hypothetical protein
MSQTDIYHLHALDARPVPSPLGCVKLAVGIVYILPKYLRRAVSVVNESPVNNARATQSIAELHAFHGF